jgi:hypothetical protein
MGEASSRLSADRSRWYWAWRLDRNGDRNKGIIDPEALAALQGAVKASNWSSTRPSGDHSYHWSPSAYE